MFKQIDKMIVVTVSVNYDNWFFMFTKQGVLQRTETSFDGVTPNQLFDVLIDNSNETDVFVNNDFHSELRGFTDALTLYDLSINQKLPIKGLEIFGNMSNISKNRNLWALNL